MLYALLAVALVIVVVLAAAGAEPVRSDPAPGRLRTRPRRTPCRRDVAMSGPIDLGSAPPTPCSTRHRRRRRTRLADALDAPVPGRRTPWPTWCAPFPSGPRRGRRWARWPATTSRRTPVSGSAITGASTPCASRVEGEWVRAVGAPDATAASCAVSTACGLRRPPSARPPRRSDARCSCASSTRRGRPPRARPGAPVIGRGAGAARRRLCLASCGSPFPGATLGQQVHSLGDAPPGSPRAWPPCAVTPAGSRLVEATHDAPACAPTATRS